MSLFNLYNWAVDKSAFLNGFSDNDELYKRANGFITDLESAAIYFLMIFLFIGIGAAVIYYGPFNKEPGRHYHPKYWAIWLGLCFVISLVLTFGVAYVVVKPNLDGAWGVEMKLSLVNAIYAAIVYLITSVVWCNCFKTNAYCWFQIGKE